MKRILPMMLLLGFFLCVQAAQADWTPAKRLTWTSGRSEAPSIAFAAPNNLHMVWQDDTSGNFDIYYKKSTDGGETWTTSQRLTWNLGASENPAIVVESSNYLHVVWQDDTPGNGEIYYITSADGGATWTKSRRLTWTSGTSWVPAIAVDSIGNLHMIWSDATPGKFELYYKRSIDGGTTWSNGQRMTWTSGSSYDPALAIDPSNNMHVVWQDDTPGNREIYYAESTDGGATWTESKRLTLTSGLSWFPVIAVTSSGKLHVAWSDDTPGHYEIYHKKSEDGGANWSASRRLTWTADPSYDPFIAADSMGNIHVVWEKGTVGNYDIFYKKSTDGGATWTTTQNLVSNWADSHEPAIAVDTSDNLHMVWVDCRSGNWEIYYKKFIK
jgi:BNR repeat-like domain